jgi:hypothetical protein
VNNLSSGIINLLIKYDLDKVLVDLGIHEFLTGDTWITSDVGRVFCGLFGEVCNDLIGSITSADKDLDNYERYDVLAGHEPAGSSTKNIVHWKQLVQSGNFQRYDYGSIMNLRVYG